MTDKRSSEDIAAYLRDLAAHTTEHGWTPVYPPTLIEAAEEIESLRRKITPHVNFCRVI